MRLAALRRTVGPGRTQAQIADAIGTSQSGVARIERQSDLLLSTLNDYVAATGGRLRVIAEYPGGVQHELALPGRRNPERAAP